MLNELWVYFGGVNFVVFGVYLICEWFDWVVFDWLLFVVGFDVYSGCFNMKGFEVVGICIDMFDLFGGVIECDVLGVLIGVVYEVVFYCVCLIIL